MEDIRQSRKQSNKSMHPSHNFKSYHLANFIYLSPLFRELGWGEGGVGIF